MRAIIHVLLCLSAVGCSAFGPRHVPPELTATDGANVVIYRTSQLFGKSGEWVPMRIEINRKVAGSLPSDSYVAIPVRAGDVTVEATDMINFHYDDENRMTLPTTLKIGETAYFRIMGIGGLDCENIFDEAERVGSGELASATRFSYITRFDSTSCFHRVSEPLGQRAMRNFRRAN